MGYSIDANDDVVSGTNGDQYWQPLVPFIMEPMDPHDGNTPMDPLNGDTPLGPLGSIMPMARIFQMATVKPMASLAFNLEIIESQKGAHGNKNCSRFIIFDSLCFLFDVTSCCSWYEAIMGNRTANLIGSKKCFAKTVE